MSGTTWFFVIAAQLSLFGLIGLCVNKKGVGWTMGAMLAIILTVKIAYLFVDPDPNPDPLGFGDGPTDPY